MGPPLQDFLCAFEPSDWVFPVAHSANCCVPPTWGAGPPAQSPVQSRVERTGAIPARRQSERYEAYLSRRSLSLWWPLNQHPAFNGREDCTLVAWYRCLTHLAREGRMTVTIGRRELLAALGGAAVAWPLAALAQQWPVRAIKVVSPFPAGSASDTVSRVVLDQASRLLGQPVVIEVRPGAGGIVG